MTQGIRTNIFKTTVKNTINVFHPQIKKNKQKASQQLRIFYRFLPLKVDSQRSLCTLLHPRMQSKPGCRKVFSSNSQDTTLSSSLAEPRPPPPKGLGAIAPAPTWARLPRRRVHICINKPPILNGTNSFSTNRNGGKPIRSNSTATPTAADESIINLIQHHLNKFKNKNNFITSTLAGSRLPLVHTGSFYKWIELCWI